MSDSSRSRRKRSRHNDPDGAGPSRDAAFKVTVSGGHRYPPKLVEQWRQGTLCDCTIVVDPETFSGHRNVLAAASGYFAGLYSGAGVVMRERNGGPAQLEGMSPEVFGAALEFMYTGECGLPETMLTELLQAASRLQVEDLLRATTQALKERLQPSNCLAIWELAERLGLAELQEHARESATRDFEKLQSSPESLFLSLPHARLATLLADMNLNVESEDAAFQAMVAWARHQQPAPSEAELEQLLSLIRFPRMTRAFLVDVVEKEPPRLTEIARDCARSRGVAPEPVGAAAARTPARRNHLRAVLPRGAVLRRHAARKEAAGAPVRVERQVHRPQGGDGGAHLRRDGRGQAGVRAARARRLGGGRMERGHGRLLRGAAPRRRAAHPQDLAGAAGGGARAPFGRLGPLLVPFQRARARRTPWLKRLQTPPLTPALLPTRPTPRHVCHMRPFACGYVHRTLCTDWPDLSVELWTPAAHSAAPRRLASLSSFRL